MLMLGLHGPGMERQCLRGAQHPSAPTGRGFLQPGAMGRWGKSLGPPQRCLGWVLEGSTLWCWGEGAKLSIQTVGLWPLPLPAAWSLQHPRGCRAEPWLQHLLERRQSSSASPPLLQPRDGSSTRMWHQVPPCSSPGPPPPWCQSLSMWFHSGWLLCQASIHAGWRSRGVLEPGCPLSAKCVVGAGVRPLQMAGAGTQSLRDIWSLNGTKKGPSPPKTGPVPVPFSPHSPGPGRAHEAPGLWIRATSLRQEWPNNSGKWPKMGDLA